MTAVVLGLGTNLGDRMGNLRAAVRMLGEAGVGVTRLSSVWETPPMPAGQPMFYNAVLSGETALEPGDLLKTVKRIERALGRRPTRQWGPRTIDIDILFYGDARIEREDLTVPHAGIGERAFVLAPLSEVVRGTLPVLGVRALDLLAQVDMAAMRRVGMLPSA